MSDYGGSDYGGQSGGSSRGGDFGSSGPMDKGGPADMDDEIPF